MINKRQNNNDIPKNEESMGMHSIPKEFFLFGIFWNFIKILDYFDYFGFEAHFNKQNFRKLQYFFIFLITFQNIF